MTFSKRERIILILTLAAVSALVLDWWVLGPLLARCDEAAAERDILLTRVTRATGTLQRRRDIERKWKGGMPPLMMREPTEAESQVLHALGDWAAKAGVNMVSLKPERSTKKTLLPEIDFRASGTGSMVAVSRFLHQLETSDIPLKIKALQLAARKEGLDDLSLQVQVSTIYTPPYDAAKAKAEADAKTKARAKTEGEGL
jgi:hypothetical protein